MTKSRAKVEQKNSNDNKLDAIECECHLLLSVTRDESIRETSDTNGCFAILIGSRVTTYR